MTRHLSLWGRVATVAALASVTGSTALGQVNLPAESIGGPLTGGAVLGAPFSAAATTTVHAVLGSGRRLDQKTTDHYYRDSLGRGRVDRPREGLPAPVTLSERHMRTLIRPDPGRKTTYSLDAQTMTTRFASIVGMTAGGSRWFSVPVGGVRFVDFRCAGDLLSADPQAFADVRDEALGNRLIARVATTGRRITLTVPAGYRGNSQPIEMVDERWESADMNLLIQSWHSDSRSTIEYRLSNVRFSEPSARLFEIPSDYSLEVSSTPEDPWASFTAAESRWAGTRRATAAR